MSKAAAGVKMLNPFSLIAKAVFPDAKSGGGGGGGDAAPAASDTRRTDEELSSQVATRDAILTSQARAAGAVRTENEADLLGSGPPTKRRAASRRLLG